MPARRHQRRPATSAVEDYLERILELINTKGYARVVDIAARLGISQASVTNMVQRLDSEGLLQYEKYRGLILTTAGEELARNITRRHEVLTEFLTCSGWTPKPSITMWRAWSTTSARRPCGPSRPW